MSCMPEKAQEDITANDIYLSSYQNVVDQIRTAGPDLDDHNIRIMAAEIFRPRFREDRRTDILESSDEKEYQANEFVMKDGQLFFPKYDTTLEQLHLNQLEKRPEEYSPEDHQTSLLIQEAFRNGATIVSTVYARKGSDNRDIVEMVYDPKTNRGFTRIVNTQEQGKNHEFDTIKSIARKRLDLFKETRLSDRIFIMSDVKPDIESVKPILEYPVRIGPTEKNTKTESRFKIPADTEVLQETPFSIDLEAAINKKVDYLIPADMKIKDASAILSPEVTVREGVAKYRDNPLVDAPEIRLIKLIRTEAIKISEIPIFLSTIDRKRPIFFLSEIKTKPDLIDTINERTVFNNTGILSEFYSDPPNDRERGMVTIEELTVIHTDTIGLNRLAAKAIEISQIPAFIGSINLMLAIEGKIPKIQADSEPSEKTATQNIKIDKIISQKSRHISLTEKFITFIKEFSKKSDRIEEVSKKPDVKAIAAEDLILSIIGSAGFMAEQYIFLLLIKNSDKNKKFLEPEKVTEKRTKTEQKDILMVFFALAQIVVEIGKKYPQDKEIFEKQYLPVESSGQIIPEKPKLYRKEFAFAYGYFFWFLLNIHEQIFDNIKTENINSPETQNKTADMLPVFYGKSFILLAIIWYLAQIREQGLKVNSKRQTVNNKKKKKKKTKVFKMPHQGVIFAYGS